MSTLSSRPPHLAALYDLPRRPSEQQIAAAAEQLVAHALRSKVRVPTKSIGAVLRSHRGPEAANLSPSVVASLTAIASRLLPPTVAPPEPVREHLPLRAAAKYLDEKADGLRARLADPSQRRLYGWPYWDGEDFRLPLTALRAESRAVYLAALPEREPDAIAATLPTWCRRQGQAPPSVGAAHGGT